MPVYLYRRQDGTTFEQRQNFSDAPLVTCPTTGQPVHRVPQASGVIFKGSGFYVTDNKSAAKSTTPAPASSASSAATDSAASAPAAATSAASTGGTTAAAAD